MIQVIFTRSSSFLSKIIRFLSKEPVSHVAIVFDNKIVFHSNLYGTHPDWYSTFIRDNEIIFILDYKYTLEQEEEIYLKIRQYDSRWYDFGGLFYFLWRGILYRLFNVPIPKDNLFGKKDQFLCTELAKIIDPTLENLDMITPYRVYIQLKEKL